MPGPRGEAGICTNCKKEENYIPIYGKSKGLCRSCYRKLLWKPKLVECKRCKRMKKHQAHGLCGGCYNSVFHIERVKANNRMKDFGIDNETYLRLAAKCVICGFDKVIELHHLDHNKKNNSTENLIGLCPNHHQMLHHRKYRMEIFEELKQKGFKVPESYAPDETFKENNDQKPAENQ